MILLHKTYFQEARYSWAWTGFSKSHPFPWKSALELSELMVYFPHTWTSPGSTAL